MKSIPGLSTEQEKSGHYSRVQADLTRPDTVSAAVSEAGAKGAFIYLAHDTPDHMKATIQALKDAGIEFVVFLSSYTVQGALSAIPPSDIIPFMHAQIELNLEAIFGSTNYVAVRPGAFATNVITWLKKGIVESEVRSYRPHSMFDYITPVDMGRVSGTILATGRQQDGEKLVYLFGPEMVPQSDALAIISSVLGKDIKVTSIDAEAGVEEFKASGLPESLARYLIEKLGDHGEGVAKSDPALYEQGVANVQKYSGKPPTGFREWAERNKELFSA